MWLEESHADLRDAFLQGDSNRALELTAKLPDGVEQMVEMTERDAPMSAQAKQCWCATAKYGFRGQRRGIEPRKTMESVRHPVGQQRQR